VITEAHGIPLAVSLTGGQRNDVTQLMPLVQAIPPVRGRRGRPRQRPDRVYADRGYDHDKYRKQVRVKGITPVIARRGTGHGSGLGTYRWVVEQSIALLHWFRPPEPPRLCTQTAITIAPDADARYRQDLPYGSPAWHARYAALRNTIEGLNGYAKDTARQALAQPARRRVRGIAAQSIFTALLLMAASIRKIRAWRALTARDKARITRRARRRRTSLRDYLPDG